MGDYDGWVKNYRKIKEWKFYKKPLHSHLFQHLIREAKFKDSYNINAQLVHRGEVDYSLRQLAKDTGLSKKQVENILKDLIFGTEIGTVYKSNNNRQLSIISITNYEDYQSKENSGDGQKDSRGTAGGQQGDNHKNIKNIKNKKNNILTLSQSKNAGEGPDLITQIVIYLNQKASKNFNPSTAKTRKVINTRIKEGYSFEDFKYVIEIKTSEWLDGEMDKYLRPETLFGSNFEDYLNQKIIKAKTEIDNNKIWRAVRGEPEELTQAEKDFVAQYGGIRQLGQMNQYDVQRILKIQ
jgi:uncharacterized phage protein (TIGR02220 family)